ncbi:MAG: SpoIIE family protein phosphatase, partial [Bacteroidales bacterium]|nr:SpoIIE family protein phosphatase [Bacteroidales bacterium]
ITGFRVNLEDRDLTQGTKLKYNENDIVFQYISICLKNPEAVAYQIMLEGADNDWRPVTTQTEVTYPALSPKKYTFKVIGRNSDGNWNREPIVFQFEIRPPFYQTSWFIILCVFIGITGIVAYVKIRERNLVREKRVLEEKVVERTAEVVAQKEQLAQKNKDITDSIRYAKRIQVAILPVEIPFEDTFVLFKPKDIVSGDFYWLEKVGNKEFLAAVDCTGHGVPGAFMSIIGTNLLNKIVKEQLVHEPAEILNILNVELINNLKTTDEENIVYDGMDLALVCYDSKTSELEYAGGYNPLLLIRDGELIEYKADRFSTGRSSSVDLPGKFTNHRVNILPGDVIYIYSDGYADQFGGETGKKFKSKPMKELFIAIHEKSVEHQRSILNSTFEAWKGEMDQVDDILIIGRKF